MNLLTINFSPDKQTSFGDLQSTHGGVAEYPKTINKYQK